MVEHEISQIVVLDQAGRPLGLLTSGQLTDNHGTITTMLVKPVRNSASKTDDLRTVVSTMFSSGQSCLPAVDDDGRFIGYVKQRDVVEMLQSPSEEFA